MKSLKISKLEKQIISKKGMASIKGGYVVCLCGCRGMGEDGKANTMENGSANSDSGYHSVGIPIEYQTVFIQ